MAELSTLGTHIRTALQQLLNGKLLFIDNGDIASMEDGTVAGFVTGGDGRVTPVSSVPGGGGGYGNIAEHVDAEEAISLSSTQGPRLAGITKTVLGLLIGPNRLQAGGAVAPPTNKKFVVIDAAFSVVVGQARYWKGVAVSGDTVEMVPDEGENIPLPVGVSTGVVHSDGATILQKVALLSQVAVADAPTMTLNLNNVGGWMQTHFRIGPLTATRNLAAAGLADKAGVEIEVEVVQDSTGLRGLNASSGIAFVGSLPLVQSPNGVTYLQGVVNDTETALLLWTDIGRMSQLELGQVALDAIAAAEDPVAVPDGTGMYLTTSNGVTATASIRRISELDVADGATITLNLATSLYFDIGALGGNRTLAATGFAGLAGVRGKAKITQGAGSNTIAAGSGVSFRTSALNILSAAASVTYLEFEVNDTETGISIWVDTTAFTVAQFQSMLDGGSSATQTATDFNNITKQGQSYIADLSVMTNTPLGILSGAGILTTGRGPSGTTITHEYTHVTSDANVGKKIRRVKHTGGSWTAWAETGGAGGTGDVSGPASSVNARIAVFSGTTGKNIDDGGVAISGLATSGHNHDASYSALGHTHANATGSVAGFMTSGDFTKLAGIATGATAYTDALAVAAVRAINAWETIAVVSTAIALDTATKSRIYTSVAGNATINPPDDGSQYDTLVHHISRASGTLTFHASLDPEDDMPDINAIVGDFVLVYFKNGEGNWKAQYGGKW